MALIDDVKAVCDDLAPHGWQELLLEHGIDITVAANQLAAELAKPVQVNRNIPGFADFSGRTGEARRGIEPGKPSFSILYHALASPNVLFDPTGRTLRQFPTLKQIETVENYVFATAKASLASLAKLAKDNNLTLGLAVFSYEYRGASDTCHERHADLVFARTGVSRVGTKGPQYDGAMRGFLPFDTADPFAFRVLPARFGAFLALRQKGSQANFCPMRFGQAGADDATLDFWLPVHKLFAGSECLTDVPSLTVTLTARHINEKIARVQRALGNPDKLSQTALAKPPFTFTDGIAELSSATGDCAGFLIPVVHPRLVEPVNATFRVRKNPSLLSSSLEIEPLNGGQHAPEYVNIRHVVVANKPDVNLNELDLTSEELLTELTSKDFRARHFTDFCGEGSISVDAPAVTKAVGKNILPAYSLVTAPDFFPSCDQRELTEWTRREVPETLRQRIWFRPPITLSDVRVPANLQLPGKPFSRTDRTMTAIVSMHGMVSPPQGSFTRTDPLRHSHLPDDAAGIFFPGWDVGRDKLNGVEHLAAYSLGSPFPEDAKLCAALSTFWPAVAPDNSRQLPQDDNRLFSVSPLTDEEIGQIGNRPWDGAPGPIVVRDGSQEFIEFDSFEHVDYVDNALAGKFSVSVLGRVDSTEYKNRVLGAALVYLFVEQSTGVPRTGWFVLSFRRLNPGDNAQREAEDAAGEMLLGQSYRFELFRRSPSQQAPQMKRKRRIAVRTRVSAFVDPVHRHALIKRENGMWRAFRL